MNGMAPDASMKSGLRLLSVEDSEADYRLVERHLRQQGIEIRPFRVDNSQALAAALDGEAWDIVLSDYSLPGEQFRDLLAMIRGRAPGVPVILVSGSVGEEAAVELLKSGVWDFVLKDNLTRLVPVIERSLHEAEEQKARLAAEQALRESEARFRALVETTFDWTWEVDGHGRYTYASPKVRDLLGYAPEEVVGKTPFDFMPADEARRVGEIFAAVAVRGLPFNALENINRHKDGRLIVLETSAMPVLGPAGELLGYRGNDRDITERRLAETGLRESEEKYRRLVEGLKDEYFFYQHDMNGVFTYLSASVEPILGYSPDEFLGHYEAVLSDDPINIKAREHTEASLRGIPQPLYEVEVRHRDGSRRRLEVLETPLVSDGLVIAVDGVAHDITKRKRIEEQVRQLSMAVEQSPVSIVITDLAANIQYINPAFSQVSGYTLAEVVGQNPRVLQSGQTPPETYRDLWGTLQRGEVWRGEFYNRHKDGHDYVELATVSPFRQPDGTITHYLAIKEDITERKRIEAELAQHRHNLEGLVASRTAELEEARREAERLARVKSEFLANMSHEIRTPLNAVLGLAQVGLRESAGRQSARTFQRVLDSGQLLLGLINDILDYSKIEAGKLAVERVPVRLDQVIDQAVDLIAEQARAKGLTFKLERTADLPPACLGDPLRLAQILVNLLSNAVKFTERGEIWLVVAAEGDRLLIRVGDSGIGMAAEQLGLLFKAFEQGDGSITRKYGGTGLGLAITHRLVGLMGGEIRVESRSGVGSTFEVRLPLEASDAPADDTAPESHRIPHGPRLAGMRVLAAEDNEVNRLVLEDLLEPEAVRLVCVDNGQAALERVRLAGPEAFDIVLMDIQMPIMDGYEATGRIHAIAPSLPVIGLTAHAMPEERQHCLDAGMVEHVSKPIDLDRLVLAMLRHARRGSPPPSESAPPNPLAGGGLVDWPGLRGRYGNREKFIARLLATACQSQGETPAKLRAAVAAHDGGQIAFLVHGVKGMAGNLHTPGVFEMAKAAELAARTDDPRAEALALGLAEAVEAMLAEFRSGGPG
jgi:PAS domain S-box-containing protein